MGWCHFKSMFCDDHMPFSYHSAYTPIWFCSCLFFLNHSCFRTIKFHRRTKAFPYMQLRWCSKFFKFLHCSVSASSHCFLIQVTHDILHHHDLEFRIIQCLYDWCVKKYCNKHAVDIFGMYKWLGYVTHKCSKSWNDPQGSWFNHVSLHNETKLRQMTSYKYNLKQSWLKI